MSIFNRIRNPEIVRNLVFGTEDSLVSTIGFVSGIASAGVASRTIILSGVILILVEAFSMAIGSLVSSNSADEVMKQKAVAYGRSTGYAFIMFFSYIVAGALVLLPYFVVPVAAAFRASICIALILLFSLGALSGYYARISPWRKGISITLIGGIAIVIGVVVGSAFN
ncbi:MAG: hypothetical protein AMXMBFR44_4690 [Candidatus Campbellbacteria bacterium]